MNVNLIHPPLTSKKDFDETMRALRIARERASKDPAYALDLLYRTGMYTKTGKIKKQFR